MITVAPSQVPAFLKGTRSDADVSAALSWAANAVEAYCERDFTLRTDDVVLVDPFWRSAQLPNPPVTAVSLVEAWMRNQSGSLSWQTLTNYRWTAEGLLYDTTGEPGTDMSQVPSWPSAPKGLRVTYTHGFATVPQAVIDAVIKAAAGYLGNPLSMSSRKVGDVESSWAVTMMQSPLDENLLAPYRLVAVPR